MQLLEELMETKMWRKKFKNLHFKVKPKEFKVKGGKMKEEKIQKIRIDLGCWLSEQWEFQKESREDRMNYSKIIQENEPNWRLIGRTTETPLKNEWESLSYCGPSLQNLGAHGLGRSPCAFEREKNRAKKRTEGVGDITGSIGCLPDCTRPWVPSEAGSFQG